MSLELKSEGLTFTMYFLVASGLPFSILVGCDILRQYSAIINLKQGEVSLNTENGIWTTSIVKSVNLPSIIHCYTILQNNYCQQTPVNIMNEWEDEEI